MAVTLTQIAHALKMKDQEALAFLKEQGVVVNDVNDYLDDSDIRKINEAIKKLKNNQTDEKTLSDHAQSNLEYCFTNYKVFIDTCSLLHFAADKFWINAVPLINKTGNKIIIPLRVIDELKKHSQNHKNSKLADKATMAIDNINRLMKADLVEIRGESTDNFTDNVFQVVFTKFRMSYKLLLITQDFNLATDILNLNKIKSVKANQVYVKRINQYGFLSNFSMNQSKESSGTVYKKSVEENSPDEDEKFALSKSITSIPDVPLKVTSIPNEGDIVIARNPDGEAKIRLEESVSSGGEGTIYKTNTPYVAKIYKKEKINKRKFEKIKLMISKEFYCDGICWPLAILYNKNNEFTGYLMSEAKGKELQKSLFIKPLLIRNFPNWRKRDTVELCITILDKIRYLHNHNIIMGDINPSNILVTSPSEVYFVDTDSYQIEGFPCPVGTVNYTAPEIQRRNFDTFLRTFGNENFAVATLLFMIMLPGKPPYSQQGGESPIDNIINMDFSYPFGEQSNKKTPDGPWRFIWSHLPYDIKEAFYHTFRMDGDYSADKKRLSVDEWLSKFKYYLQLLDSGKFGSQDKMSEELFPVRYKKNPNVTYVKCNLCGREVSEESCRNGMCQECLNTGDVYECSRCGKEIIFTNYLKYIKNAKRHEYCQDCYDHLNEIYTTIRCSDCGSSFDITNGQHEYFESKGFSLPKRCAQCRKRRQNSSSPIRSETKSNISGYSDVNRQPHVKQTPTVNKPKTSNSGGNSWCYITTAVCDYFNKPDDCYELKTLRDFRDNRLKNMPGGVELIKEYYNIAPSIVANLEKTPIKDAIYTELYKDYLNPCIEYIEEEKYDYCKEKYIEMVTHLKNIFLN